MQIYIFGEAPSKKSKDFLLENGSVEAFPNGTPSGDRVHALVATLPVERRNASDHYLGLTNDGSEKKPTVSMGRNKLFELVHGQTEPSSLCIVLASIRLWRPVVEQAVSEGWAELHTKGIFSGPITLKRGEINVGKAIILPHPRGWPLPEGETRDEYRSNLLVTLEKIKYQNKKVAACFPWTKTWVDQSFTEFGL